MLTWCRIARGRPWDTLVLVLLLLLVPFLVSRQCLTFRITTSPFVAENSTSSPSAIFSISAISGGIVSLRDPPILTRVRFSVIGIGSPSDIAIRYIYIPIDIEDVSVM
jgi:hypothetical protein